MMLPKLEDVKKLRKKIGLTQVGLAKLSGVSQSIIAKIERKYTVPNYSTAKKIFETLKKCELESKLKAKDIMTPKIISVKPNDKVSIVAKTLNENNISQCPIINEGIIIGSVTEKDIIKNFLNPKIKELPVKDIMDEPFPIISINTPLPIISTLLNDFPALIVTNKGIPKGIISKADLLKTV